MSTKNFGILADDEHVVVTCPNTGEDVRVEIFPDEIRLPKKSPTIWSSGHAVKQNDTPTIHRTKKGVNRA